MKELIEFLGGKEKQDPTPIPSPRWIAPLPNIIKINVDAVFQPDKGEGGWGLVARDYSGEFISATEGKLLNQSSARQGEAEALLKAIQTAESLGMGCVHYETD